MIGYTLGVHFSIEVSDAPNRIENFFPENDKNYNDLILKSGKKICLGKKIEILIVNFSLSKSNEFVF